jgi:hypothetical protein
MNTDALKAVLEALDIPHAATVGEEAKRDEILKDRICHTVVFLRGILAGDGTDVEWSIAYLREQLAKNPPVGYRTWGDRVTELAR